MSYDYTRNSSGFAIGEADVEKIKLLIEDMESIMFPPSGQIIGAVKTSEYQDWMDSQFQDGEPGVSQVGLGVPVYSYIHSIISHPDGTPRTGVDPSVHAWVSGAMGVNENSNFQGSFIQNFTIAQFNLRLQEGDPAAKGQAASNEIALNLARDIALHNDVPDITTLGVIDAGAAASQVFGGDYAPWAGTLLFLYLGVPEFLKNWLLPESMNEQVVGTVDAGDGSEPQAKIFKKEAGIYDLFTVVYSGREAVLQAAPANVAEALQNTFGPGNVPFPDTSALQDDINTYAMEYYGLADGDVLDMRIGDSLVLAGAAGFLNAAAYSVGTIGDDQYTWGAGRSGSLYHHAGNGNDLLNIAVHQDGSLRLHLDGGQGDDFLSWRETNEAIVFDVRQGSGGVDFWVQITNEFERIGFYQRVYNVESFELTEGDDTIILRDTGNTLTIQGGEGTDTLKVGDASSVQSQPGMNTMLVGSTQYILYDIERLELSSGNDNVSLEDLLPASTNQARLSHFTMTLPVLSYLHGGGGHDALYGTARQETIEGGTGNDTLWGGGGGDELYGGDGDDTFHTPTPSASNGFSMEGADSLYGGNGDDHFLQNHVGYDLDGGAGHDSISYAQLQAGVDIFIFAHYHPKGYENPDYVEFEGRKDWLYLFETIVGTSFNDSLTISAANYAMTFDLGGGYDTVHFQDILKVVYQGEGVVRTWVSGYNAPSFSVDHTLKGVEELIGSQGNDHIRADIALRAIIIDGLYGSDTIIGDSHTDIIRGGYDDDKLYAGSGQAKLFGGSGGDLLYGGTSLIGIEMYGGDDRDSLSGAEESDHLYGGKGADSLYGGTGGDILHGNNGDDFLYGETGNDRLFGGSGNDTVYGGDGLDTLEGGGGADVLEGGEGSDTLYGGAGNDSIYSQGGQAHALYGGTGADTLWGGDNSEYTYFQGDEGSDTFIASGSGVNFYGFKAGFGSDIITNFNRGDGLVFDYNTLYGKSMVITGNESRTTFSFGPNGSEGRVVVIGLSKEDAEANRYGVFGYNTMHDEMAIFT